jgi:tRNA A37 threonylcarbamoyladenosine biosynthesis protein TsaE
MRDELTEALSDPKAVVVVEWSGIVEEVLPARRLAVTIKTMGETSRELEFQYINKLKYLLPVNT